MEGAVASLYGQLLAPPTHAALQRARTSGAGFGFSQGCMYLAYALSFWCHLCPLHSCLVF